MSFKQVMQYEVLRTFDSASLTGTFQPIGGPLLNEAGLIKCVNESSVTVVISVDGINPHDVVPGNGFFLYDITSDSVKSVDAFAPKGRQYSVRGTASTGLIYLVVQYVEIG